MEGGLRDGGFLNLPPMPLCFGGGFGVNEDVSMGSFPYAYCKRERTYFCFSIEMTRLANRGELGG